MKVEMEMRMDEAEDEVEGEEGEIDLVLDGEAVDEGEEDPVDHEEEGDAEVHEEEEEGDEAIPPAQDTTPYVRGPATLSVLSKLRRSW